MREPRREEEATSKETLEDLEKTKKISESSGRNSGQETPSPDGEPTNRDRDSIEGVDV
jgi:hypothetical protein